MHRILSALPSNDWEGSKGLPVPLSACVFKTLIHGSGYRQRGLYGCHHWGGKTNKGILIPKVFLPFRSRGRNRRGEGISLFLRSRLKTSWLEETEATSSALILHGFFPCLFSLSIWVVTMNGRQSSPNHSPSKKILMPDRDATFLVPLWFLSYLFPYFQI